MLEPDEADTTVVGVTVELVATRMIAVLVDEDPTDWIETTDEEGLLELVGGTTTVVGVVVELVAMITTAVLLEEGPTDAIESTDGDGLLAPADEELLGALSDDG